MQTIKIYTAGACSNVSLEEAQAWRQHLQHRARQLYADGIISVPIQIINVNDFYYGVGGDECVDPSELMHWCLNTVRNCDAVICNCRSLKSSKGTTAELVTAEFAHKPIIGVCDNSEEEFYPWDKACMTRIITEENLDEACDLALQYVCYYFGL